jgi:hypothetical protein
MVSVVVQEGPFNQGYKLGIEIIANDDEIPAGAKGLTRAKAGYDLFILDVKIEAIDYETEIREYEDLIRNQIEIMA